MDILWTKIYSFTTGNQVKTVGLGEKGEFIVEFSSKRLVKLLKFEDYVSLISVLETDREKFESAWIGHIEKNKLDNLIQTLLKCGLSGSPYWTNLVINWLNKNDITEELRTPLRQTISDKRINQKLRHKVRKLLK